MRLPANLRSSSAGSFDRPNVPNLDFLCSSFRLSIDVLPIDALSSIDGRPEAVSTTVGPVACFWRVKGWNLLDLLRCRVGRSSVTSSVGAVVMIDGATTASAVSV
jgi:hypothetical protein